MSDGNYVFQSGTILTIVKEGANLCTKILNNQHRGINLTGDDLQSLYDEKRRISAQT
jgi:hypothetical protein